LAGGESAAVNAHEERRFLTAAIFAQVQKAFSIFAGAKHSFR